MLSNTEIKNIIGKRIREFRTEHGYTQYQFAEMIDISVNFLSELENGKKGMSQETLYRLCECFQISADFILFGTVQDKKTSKDISSLINYANSLNQKELLSLINYLSSLYELHNSLGS